MNKNILILGAKSDIAKAVANKFIQNGYSIHLAARDSQQLESFKSDLTIKHETSVQLHDFDVTNLDSHQEFFNKLEPKPEIVFTAVGYLGDQKVAESNFSEVYKIAITNYLGLMSILNIVANYFESKKQGTIIGISSVAGDRGRQSNYFYGSAKAAFSAYLSGLRNRLFSSNVHVLTVKPGFVATKMTENMDLPKMLTASPDLVAKNIFKAYNKKQNILYTMWVWQWIMLIIKFIPENIFKKLKL